MKKTLTINLGGTVYHIDDDAYRLLDNYLSNLKHYFRKQEGAEEIVNDIEMRIAELFAEKIAEGKQVITVSDVEEIIARVGKPEDFGITDDDTDSQKKTEQSASGNQSYAHTAAPRRWFRDPDNKLLGGVASGLAAYFDWDITLVRILMIILVFVPYCPMIILYIIGWIVIPEAHTAAEKLSMHGKAVTIENIGKTVTDGFERVADGVNNYMNSGKPRTFLQKVGDVFVSIAAVLFKIFLVALVIICCPVLFVLAVVLVPGICRCCGSGQWRCIALRNAACHQLDTGYFRISYDDIAWHDCRSRPDWYSIGSFPLYYSSPVIPLVTDGDRLEMVVADSMDIGCSHYGN